jgi:hypothetical protein
MRKDPDSKIGLPRQLYTGPDRAVLKAAAHAQIAVVAGFWHDSRRTLPVFTQRARSMPRVVRLGRPANDNARQPAWRARVILIGFAAAVLAAAAAEWMLR